MTPRHALAASLVALGLTATLVPATVPAAAAPDPGRATTARAAIPTLVEIEARHRGASDRVVFRFKGGVPDGVDAEWVDTLFADGSGLPVRVAGAKVLSLVFHGVDAHNSGGSTIPARTAFPLPNVITAVQAGDFEATVTVGLGVQKRTAYTVLTKSNRIVVDVEAAFPTSTRQVFFVDRQAVSTGTPPLVVPVHRPIRNAAPAAAVLHALFAGPTPDETFDDLRLVRSRAWGFNHLSISGGIARLRLTHGCGSGGSTITVANQIMPTLKQFPTVDWVKIYDPNGKTEQPNGPVDSIPACLEP